LTLIGIWNGIPIGRVTIAGVRLLIEIPKAIPIEALLFFVKWLK
jgi:hypothetical protein